MVLISARGKTRTGEPIASERPQVSFLLFYGMHITKSGLFIRLDIDPGVRTQSLHLPPAACCRILLSGAKDRAAGPDMTSEQKAISHLFKIKHPIRWATWLFFGGRVNARNG